MEDLTSASAPGAISADLSILKNSISTSRSACKFRAEILNFVNRANFALPGRALDVRGTGNGLGARFIQLDLYF